MSLVTASLFGKLVNALKEEGIYDDTWILFFSDHGDFTGDYSQAEKTMLTMQDVETRVIAQLSEGRLGKGES